MCSAIDKQYLHVMKCTLTSHEVNIGTLSNGYIYHETVWGPQQTHTSAESSTTSSVQIYDLNTI